MLVLTSVSAEVDEVTTSNADLDDCFREEEARPAAVGETNGCLAAEAVAASRARARIEVRMVIGGIAVCSGGAQLHRALD